MTASPPAVRTLRMRFAWRAAALTLILLWLIGAVSAWYWPEQIRNAVRDGVVDHLRALDAELDLAEFPLASGTPLVLPAPEQFVQVVAPDGRVVAASSELITHEPLVSVSFGDVTRSEDMSITIPNPEGTVGEAFIMARRIRIGGTDYLGIVGASLDRVDDGRRFVLWATGLGGPILALVVGLGVWLAVTLALRPVNDLAEEADRLARGRGPWQLTVTPETTELRRLATGLDDLLAQIRDTFEREREFLDDASHELRTPIAVARGELDLALDTEDLEELTRAVRSSIEELDRLDRLAADLLLLARARGGDESSFAEVALGGLARRAANALMRRRDSKQDVRVIVKGERRVIGDEQALERAIANIVSNAIEHCQAKVQIQVRQASDQCIVRVVDDGPGFPPEMLNTALERFTRTKDGRRDGTGLGLYIASEITAAHEGGLEIGNRDGGGAVVTLWLPAPSTGDHPPARIRPPRLLRA